MKPERKIYIFDTTLRDGEQSPGASLLPEEKLKIAKQLECLNVDVIEAGFPASSEGEMRAVAMIAEHVRKPVICGLSRMIPRDIDACRSALEGAAKKRIHVFLATSQIHREFKLKKGKREIIEMAVKNIRSARKDFRQVEFSPEDASRTERDFLVDVVRAAIDAGATSINIPDTVGYAIPEEFSDLIRLLIRKNPALGKQIVLSVHCHNDLGLATANSIAAVLAGANQIECTVNGIGERAGNASVEEIAMILNTRRDFMGCYTDIKLSEITKSSRLVSHLTGMVVQPNKAIVGRNAFWHASGIHQDGILKKRQTYEIMNPKKIGLSGNQLMLGKLSGKHAFAVRVKKLGFNLSAAEIDAAFVKFKTLADKKKYIFDEDIEAILQNQIAQVPETWKLVSMKVVSETGQKPSATIRLSYQGQVSEASSTGDGPVEACYKAIETVVRSGAQVAHYGLQSVTGGKDALGDVVVKLVVGTKEVSGRGTSTDVIEASVRAYLFALNKLCQEPKRGSASASRRKIDVRL
ncbi:MAG TPA: 2-isopropylmalate synthase [Candidatus Omnitrophota bacterium]|jgi:2-isopropylmalate synthase|nr:MAG: 2-isopropylmalate synthase [Candidatus Omnitrophica bacterium ADurb.Bin314]HOE68223.1 2-isopropylmalate synthase [Candidatus Omnitrophota bacterium]HQB94693.1 2-isopropylmalate synthase [Candidatus Omnitrophota bacterium]